MTPRPRARGGLQRALVERFRIQQAETQLHRGNAGSREAVGRVLRHFRGDAVEAQLALLP